MTGDAVEIRRLDQQTIERIAAGEVVERPASAVKELLENSIDADSSRVTVTVESGGIEGISVRDDGRGMDEAALRRAVEEHTTSKITDIDDLESGVGTLGFRGEALHAIGAVSRMTVTSRPRGGDEATELTVEGGEITDVSRAGRPEGTTVEVRDLFYNVPARRKYLKQESTEFAHVNSIVTQYALANPDVAIALEHDGRETFATTGSGNLQEAILSVYGREVAESMISVDAASDSETDSSAEIQSDTLPAGPLDAVSGLVSHPETNRASKDYLSTFVNGRFVRSGTVRDAVVDAYGGQLASDRFPFAVVFLELDPGAVDVNVHPRKLEVRFAADEAVREQVRTAVEDALLDEGLLRSSAPRGRSAADQTEIAPERVDGTAEAGPESDATEPLDASAPDYSAGNVTFPESPEPEEGTHTREAPAHRPDASGEVETDATERSRASTSEGTPESPADSLDETGHSVSRTDPDASRPEHRAGALGDTTPDASTADAKSPRRFRPTGRQVSLEGERADRQFDRLPAMRILGQLHETYVVAETEEGLVLIDQHAADERINYERLQESLSGQTTTQALADPVAIELTAREAELFAAHRDALAQLGFHASLVDDRVVEVTTVPSFVAENADPSLIRDVLAEFVGGEAAAAETVEAVADDLLADLACYPSVTGNTSLTEGSVLDLLTELDECENPYACPHGRPVIVEFDRDEIEGRFERDYPGHG